MFEKVYIILLVNLLFFFETLCYSYCSDDIPAFQNPPKTKNVWEKIYYWLEGRSRINPQVDRALTILIHSLVCVFIYLGFGKNDISFWAALLFAVNPSNNQASVWIAGRSYALSALGMTASLAFPVLCVPFILLAVSTNPGFIAPIVFLGSEHFWMFGIGAMAWLVHWKRFTGNVKQKMSAEMFDEDRKIKPEKLILAIKTFGFYTTLAIIPFKNTFYHSFLQSAAGCGKEKAYSIKDRFFWLGVIYAIAIVIYLSCFTWNIVSLGFLWWCVCIAPFLNFIRMSQEIAERYMYLPSVGLMVVLSVVLSQYNSLYLLFFGAYATRLWFLMKMYQDDHYLIEHSCINSPQSWFAWHLRGMKRWDNHSHQEAIIMWTMARMIHPKEFKVNLNIATALRLSNHPKEAEQFLKVAEDNIPHGQEKDAGKIIKEWKEGKFTIVV